jgi:hypothetical protein
VREHVQPGERKRPGDLFGGVLEKTSCFAGEVSVGLGIGEFGSNKKRWSRYRQEEAIGEAALGRNAREKDKNNFCNKVVHAETSLGSPTGPTQDGKENGAASRVSSTPPRRASG